MVLPGVGEGVSLVMSGGIPGPVWGYPSLVLGTPSDRSWTGSGSTSQDDSDIFWLLLGIYLSATNYVGY